MSDTPVPTTPTSMTANSVDARLRISAMWIATMFVFVYVDLFSLYRPDVRADLDEGRVHTFGVGEEFLLFTTAFVVVPSLMIIASLVLPARINRRVNVGVAAVYMAAITVSAVGEWWYFVFGSVIEVALLLWVIVTARELTPAAAAGDLAATS